MGMMILPPHEVSARIIGTEIIASRSSRSDVRRLRRAARVLTRGFAGLLHN
jgi:hypothetical protein